MTVTLDPDLVVSLREMLAAQPPEAVPLTYQQAAQRLGLEPPHTIHRLALALEALMQEDAAAGRPFIAALVVSRSRQGLPAPGFFDTAIALGRLPPNPPDRAACYQAEFDAAVKHYCR